MQNDHKATCSAVFILLNALILLLCSLFRMSGQDSDGKSTLQLYVQRCMSNDNLRDRQASDYRCQRSTVGAVLKLLFTLFE